MKTFLAGHWFLLALAAGLLVALLFPTAVDPLTAYLRPRFVIGVALFLMAWTMPSRNLLGELLQPAAALWAIVLSYGLLPVAAWLVGRLAPWPDLRIGLLLSASVPCTLASAVLWTRLAAGNDATALLVAIGTTLLSWAATTFWLLLTTGASVELDAVQLMLDLVITLILPVGLGQALRLHVLLRGLANQRARVLGGLAQMFVLSIIVKAAAEVGLKARAEAHGMTLDMLGVTALCTLGLHVGTLFFGLQSSAWLGFDRPRAIAVAISCSQKTLPLALYLFHEYYREFFPLAVVPLLFFHVGQLLVDTFIARRLAQAMRVSPA